MSVQPKLLTVVLANDDLATTYTTLHSVQSSRYRNHEIVCVVPYHRKTLLAHIKRDFVWLPVISAPYASISTLLDQCTDRAIMSYCDAILYIQAGAVMQPNTIHQLTQEYNRYVDFQLIMPTHVRGDGSGMVYGAVQRGRMPHQLKSVTEALDQTMPQSPHFVGGVCIARIAVCKKYRFHGSADDLALLYWSERVLAAHVKSVIARDTSVVFDGPLYSDFNDMLIVPQGWYDDAKRYITKHGSWYDKLVFYVRFRWRVSGSLFGRMMDLAADGRLHSRTIR